jgi:hypothetical protein
VLVDDPLDPRAEPGDLAHAELVGHRPSVVRVLGRVHPRVGEEGRGAVGVTVTGDGEEGREPGVRVLGAGPSVGQYPAHVVVAGQEPDPLARGERCVRHRCR